MNRFGHDYLHNRYIFTGELRLETALKIASGLASERTDAPVLRDFADRVYIPGSSLRGAVRSELERILAALGKESCVLFTENECAQKIAQKIKEFNENFTSDAKKNTLLAQAFEENLCCICRIFGSAGYGSKIFFSDCQVRGTARTVIRDNVAIDRDSGAAVDKAKFDYEVVEPDITFSLRIEAENLNAEEKKLVRCILNLLEQGLHVGGKRAAGLGRIALTSWTVQGVDSPTELWEKIQHGPWPDKTASWSTHV